MKELCATHLLFCANARWLYQDALCERISADAVATNAALSVAGEPSGRTVTSSSPVRMPWPRSRARRLTAQQGES